MTSDVLTAVNIEIMAFWGMMPCILADKYLSFGETFCLHLEDNGDSRFI
jgi:hypothetical protein